MRESNVTKRKQSIKYFVGDLLTGNVAFFLFNIARFHLLQSDSTVGNLWEFVFSKKLLLEQLTIPLVMCGIFWLSGYYNQPLGKSRLQELLTTVFSTVVNTSIIYFGLMINDVTGHRSLDYEMLLLLFLILFICCYPVRIMLTQSALRNFRERHWRLKTLIVGNSEIAHRTALNMMTKSSRVSYEICGFVRIPGETDGKEETGEVFELNRIQEICQTYKVDNIIVIPQNIDEKKILSLLYHLFPLDVSIRIAPDTFSFVTSSIRLKDIFGEPFVDITSPAISESSKNLKRSFDVLISLLLITAFSPLFLVIAIMVKSSSPGQVIFCQERIGWKQRPFIMYKFRTMVEGAEKNGPELSSKEDIRITKIGKFLRRYRLDELPQFWNVVKGDMSIVGPRPERRYYIEKIIKEAPYYALVCQVRPGITSWGMVKYGYASCVMQMVERTRYDLIYLSNMSLTLDLKILIYTVKTVISGKGV